MKTLLLPFALTSCCTDYIQHIGSAIASLSPCSLPQRLYRQAQSLLRSLLPWSNIASKTGIQYSRTMWYDSGGCELPQHQHLFFLFQSFSVINWTVCIFPQEERFFVPPSTRWDIDLQSRVPPSIISGTPAAGRAFRRLDNIPDSLQVWLKIRVCCCSSGPHVLPLWTEIKPERVVELPSLCTIPDTENVTVSLLRKHWTSVLPTDLVHVNHTNCRHTENTVEIEVSLSSIMSITVTETVYTVCILYILS